MSPNDLTLFAHGLHARLYFHPKTPPSLLWQLPLIDLELLGFLPLSTYTYT
jgi:hypothetical protein